MSGRQRDRAVDLAISTVLAVLILGPFLLRRGFALRGDMVLVPHQPWKDAWLGLDGTAPRFVPGDAVLSVLTALVPGDLLQKGLLLGALLLAGAGAGRLVARQGVPGRAAAIVLFLWNPWVLERLSIGQWGSVVGYAALPWVVLAAAGLREDTRRSWPRVVLWLAFSALWSPAAGLVGALTAFCVVVVGGRLRPVLVTMLVALLVNLPWVVPSLLSADRIASPGDQFEAFSARAESGAGVVASVLSLGGIWKSSVVPEERTLALVVLLSCLTTVLAVVALWRGRHRHDAPDRRTTLGLALLAVLVVLVVLVPTIPWVTDLLDDGARDLPALAALRDGHRYLGPAVLVLLPGVALAADALWAAGRHGTEALRAVAVLVVLLPALCLPSLLWGLNNDLRPVTYPGEWFRAAAVVEADLDRGGATIVLPWRGTYRGFPWNDSRAMLDPAPRFLEGTVLIDDRIYLRDRVLDNEDPRLAEVTAALEDEAAARSLTDLGIARVLLEKHQGVGPQDLPDGDVLHDGEHLTLLALGDPAPVAGPGDTRRVLIVLGDLLAGLACLVAAAGVVRRRVYGEPAVDSGRGSA